MNLAGWRRVALALTAAAVLAACGGSGSSATNTESKASPTPTPTKKSQQFVTVDACKLVAATDASTAAGTAVTQLPTGAGAAQASICIFGSQSSDQNQAGVFVITSVYPDQATANAVNVDQLAASFGGQFGVTGVSNARVVNGIGDKAVEYTATKTAGSGVGIFVFRANVVIFVVLSPISSMSTADATTKLEALAKVAVSNLDSQPKS